MEFMMGPRLNPPRRRWALVRVSLSAVVFVLSLREYGRSPLMAQDEVQAQYKIFASALEAIERTYVEDVPSERLIYSALGGLMNTLDPHSHVEDPRQYAQTRQQQEGRYYGIGVSIQSVKGDVVIVSVTEHAPAFRTGLRRGDVIARIAGQDASGWTTEQASAALKGPLGTVVDVAIKRPGFDTLFNTQVRRDEVHLVTVPAAIMLDAETGYLKLAEFGENADREVGEALEVLNRAGMRRLVFDLRDNPGGVLDQAILVASRFLPRGALIVYTRGRVDGSAHEYQSEQRDPLRLPMITLVDRGSASASEIVSGALQDHDRSLIVGETTFGKALVQSVYRLSHGGAAAITTARYYTPSGRLIQRPWDGTFDDYRTYTLLPQSTSTVHPVESLKYTDMGRKVYAGGGIEPDRRLEGPIEGFNPTRFGRALVAANVFERYAQRFTRRGDARFAASVPEGYRLSEDYRVSEAMLDEFKGLVRSSGVRFDEAAWRQDAAFVSAMIRKEIDTDLFGQAVVRRHLAGEDPQLQFALTLFPDALALRDARAAAPGPRPPA